MEGEVTLWVIYLINTEKEDIFKLGLLEFNVTELASQNLRASDKIFCFQGFGSTYLADKTLEGTCRFCLCEEET